MAIGVIILAAGGSSRMGSPKQLLPFQGQSLVRHAAQCALGSVCDRVVVVTGCHADEVKREVEDLPLSVIENRSWQSGMSSSIRAGLEEMVTTDDIESVIVMLCDQPFVSPDVLNDLVDAQRTSGKPIVASTYGATRGVPAIFSGEFFSELALLTADQGARRVIAANPADVATISFPQGAIDVDTPHDHQIFSRRFTRMTQI